MISALGWFLYRRKQKKPPSPPEQDFINQDFDELHQSAVPVQEMDAANDYAVHELSSHTYK
jgi:hypothetical protein